VLALFNKAMRKLHSHLKAAKEAAVERQLPRPTPRATPAAAAAGAGVRVCTRAACACAGRSAAHEGTAWWDGGLPLCRARTAGLLAPSEAVCAAQVNHSASTRASGGPPPLLGGGVLGPLDEELEAAAAAERDKMRTAFKPEELAQYAIKGACVCAGAAGARGCGCG
jgi:hypothetical protein